MTGFDNQESQKVSGPSITTVGHRVKYVKIIEPTSKKGKCIIRKKEEILERLFDVQYDNVCFFEHS